MSGSRPPGVTPSNWDLGGEPSAWAYLHADELFPSVEIPAAGPAAALEEAEAAEIAQFPVQPGMSLEEYVASGPVSGIVVVWRGRIAFERYPWMRPGERHLLMSVTKAFTSAVAGILELGGVLDLRQPVDLLIGDLFKGGFGGQGLYVSPARDLVIAFTGTPRQDGSVNLLRWYSRRLAAAIS
jgi:CubicO group peptidase (beta-lactamase class C family)